MQRLRMALLLAMLMLLASVSMVSAQTGSTTSFITSITFQNVGTANTTVQFQFYAQTTTTPAATVNVQINKDAGSALFVGNVNLPANFLGSAVLSSDQPMVATLVQVPQPSNGVVKNRPLTNGFDSATSNVLLATVLKNKFNTVSQFSIQNADTNPIDITIKFFNADDPNALPIQVQATNIPPGSAKYYRMDQANLIDAATFNGSATVTAVRTGTETPANIVGSVLELSTVSVGVSAFEGVQGGNSPVFVASALCQAFGGASTSYAVQNVDPTGTAPAAVTVKYKGVNLTTNAPVNVQASSTINPGAKFGFLACNAPDMPQNFNGAATIESSAKLVVIAKVFGGGLTTAWLGEGAGSEKLAFPYVRFSDDAKYNAGTYQRVFIAIQNVGPSDVSNVTVEYRDKNGTLLGTQTIASIAVGAKAATNPTTATGSDPNKLLFFGNPEANPGGGFGGGAIVIGPAGSKLIGVARVQSITAAGRVAEDYNGIALD